MRELAEATLQANQLVVFDRGSVVVIAQQEAPGYWGIFDPRGVAYQPVRYGFRPCVACLSVRLKSGKR
jgi:DNA-binding IclR family transcriptional regulator